VYLDTSRLYEGRHLQNSRVAGSFMAVAESQAEQRP
jgi:hypothetical protein